MQPDIPSGLNQLESDVPMVPRPPGGYTLEEWELLIERDVLADQPPPFADRWVVYCDVDGFERVTFDPAKRVRVAHVYWDIVRSLAWGVRHHRVLAVKDAVLSDRIPEGDAGRRELQKARLELWRPRVRIFSDSIFIFLDPRADRADVDAAEYSLDGRFVASVAASVSRRLWVAGLPHRGGIAFGKCLMDPLNSVFVGEPIVHAFRAAQSQEWLGYVVHPGSATAARAAFGGEAFLFDGEVPEKVESRSIAWCGRFHVLPFPSALMARREGPEVNRDAVLVGLLDAFDEVDPSDGKVRSRYARTARIWLRDGGIQDDVSLARLEELAELEPRP